MISTKVNEELATLAGAGNGGSCLCPSTYWKSDPRILWVLRETNGLRGSLSKFLSRGDLFSEEYVWGALWQKVGMCSYGILYEGTSFSGVSPARVGHGKAFKGLGSVAVTNAKKSAGGSAAVMEQVLESFLLGGDVFRKEMKLLQPELVICGGTWELVAGWIGYGQGEFKRHPADRRKKARYWALDVDTATCERVFRYKPRAGRVTFLWAGHPAGRGSPKVYYQSTVEAALWALGRRRS